MNGLSFDNAGIVFEKLDQNRPLADFFVLIDESLATINDALFRVDVAHDVNVSDKFAEFETPRAYILSRKETCSMKSRKCWRHGNPERCESGSVSNQSRLQARVYRHGERNFGGIESRLDILAANNKPHTAPS